MHKMGQSLQKMSLKSLFYLEELFLDIYNFFNWVFFKSFYNFHSLFFLALFLMK